MATLKKGQVQDKGCNIAKITKISFRLKAEKWQFEKKLRLGRKAEKWPS